MSKPKWWPECPWPAEVWPMTQEDYIAAVPDPKLRTAISGFLMRRGWELCEEDILRSLKDGGSVYDKLRDILLSEE